MIGFYAHHHGTGHMTRCRAIADALGPDVQTTILSSRPEADVILPMDAPAAEGSAPQAVTAHGALHWAPPRHRGLARRMAQVSTWIVEHEPSVMHVDVSVEMAVFIRAMGVPVTLQAMPGTREDDPHALGYRIAEAIIAAWPDWIELPPHLRTAADRVHRVGGISRFAERHLTVDDARPPSWDTDTGRCRVVILVGAGGTDAPVPYWQEVAAVLSGSGFPCELLGAGSWFTDPYPVLRAAGVVVTTAGQNAIADVATLAKPAVVIPQTRPFDEQEATAQVLADAGLALLPDGVPERMPSPETWPSIIDRARRQNPRWTRWQTDGAAHRAAQVLRAVAQ